MEGCDEEVRSLRPICGLALTLCLFGGAARAEAPAGEPAWRQSPPKGVAVGDLVFRRGQGMWTRYFINMSTREKRFSHVGIVTQVTNDTAKILHADAHETTGIGCVRIEDWCGFYSNTLDCAVYRYCGPDAEAVIPRIVTKGKEKLGVPFDSAFDLATEDRLYCTEFVRAAVNGAAGRELIKPVKISGISFIPLDEVYRQDVRLVFDAKRAATP